MNIGTKASDTLVLAHDGGQWLVGERKTEMSILGVPEDVLSPVFAFGVSVQPTPDGQVMIQYGAQPILFIGKIERWKLSAAANVFPVDELGSVTAAQIRAAVAQGADQAQSMRAQQAGIAIARQMPALGRQ